MTPPVEASQARHVARLVHNRLGPFAPDLDPPYPAIWSGRWLIYWDGGPQGWARVMAKGGKIDVPQHSEVIGKTFLCALYVSALVVPAGLHVQACGPELEISAAQAQVELSKSLQEFGPCHYCGQQDVLTRDHVVPRSRGGAFGEKNVVFACAPCNHLKGDFLLEELPPGWEQLSRADLRVRRRVVASAWAERRKLTTP